MSVAATYSLRKKLCSEATVMRILKLLQLFNLPTKIPEDINFDHLASCIMRDKKVSGYNINFVTIHELGRVFLSRTTLEELFTTLNAPAPH